MKRRINIHLIVKFIAFWLIFALIFSYTSKLICLQWLEGETTNTATWEEFESLEENSLDVIFTGTSHVYSGIDPFYIYENTGIESFVLANGSARTDEAYIMLNEAFKTQSPKMVIMDASVLHYTDANEESKIHRVYDQISNLNSEKWTELKRSDAENIDLWDYLIPIFRYHARWSDLKKRDFQYAAGTFKAQITRGHYVNYDIVDVDRFQYFDADPEPFEMTEHQEESFAKIVKLCQDKGCDLLVMKIPNPDWQRPCSEAVAAMCESYGVPYIEVLDFYEELGIELNHDFRDTTNHMNEYGSEKMSGYFADYLTENITYEDKRGNDPKWDRELESYHEFKKTVYDQYLEKEKKK